MKYVISTMHENTSIEGMKRAYERMEGAYTPIMGNSAHDSDTACAYSYVVSVLTDLIADMYSRDYTLIGAFQVAVNRLQECLHDGLPTRARIYREAIRNIKSLLAHEYTVIEG